MMKDITQWKRLAADGALSRHQTRQVASIEMQRRWFVRENVSQLAIDHFVLTLQGIAGAPTIHKKSTNATKRGWAA